MWFTNIIKPTHQCNLNCSYCYNEDTRNSVMSADLLHRTIKQTFEYAQSLGNITVVDFIWHGGEPMLAGLPFYIEAVRIQEKTSRGLRYANSIQTNGVLLNNKWIDFFRKQCFDVSLSIDGPELVHNSLRLYPNGSGSFKDVMRGIYMLKETGISHGVCVVISRVNRDRTDEIFDFLSKEKLHFNVIPITRSGGAFKKFDMFGLAPGMYAEPWIKLFDRWFKADNQKYVSCTDFIRKARAILAGKPMDCIGQRQCAKSHISTDPDGFVYPCATLSGNPEWSYGNLIENSLYKLMNSQKALKIQNRPCDPRCKSCKWKHVCHSGCMARSIKFYGKYEVRDYYCPSLYRIYEHIENSLRSVNGLDKSVFLQQ